MRAFCNTIKSDIITLYTASNEQNRLPKAIKEFRSKTRPSNEKKKKKI